MAVRMGTPGTRLAWASRAGMLMAIVGLIWFGGSPEVFAQNDITAPTISSITSDPEDDDESYYHMNAVLPLYNEGVYGIGDDIQVTVTFSQGVTVTGSQQLELDVGGTAKTAEYDSTDGSKVVFSYKVAEGDSDTDGIAIDANKLTLNSGSIREAMDNDADLSHSALSAQ